MSKVTYYKMQLDKVKGEGGAMKIVSAKGETKYIALNVDSIPAIIDYLVDELTRLELGKTNEVSTINKEGE